MQRSTIMASIRRPESAAVAGLVFAVLLAVALYLLHGAAPVDPQEIEGWATDQSRLSSVNLAINLLPFAGIAFLWFIAVIRTHLGALDDRFFETVFLGSGLVFVASLFTAASALKAVLILDASGSAPNADTAAFAWTFATAALAVFGAKMAAVFTFSAASAGIRAHTLPRWLGLLGYLTGLSLMFIPPLPTVAQFIFPAWVAMISVLILVRRRAGEPDDVIV